MKKTTFSLLSLSLILTGCATSPHLMTPPKAATQSIPQTDSRIPVIQKTIEGLQAQQYQYIKRISELESQGKAHTQEYASLRQSVLELQASINEGNRTIAYLAAKVFELQEEKERQDKVIDDFIVKLKLLKQKYNREGF